MEEILKINDNGQWELVKAKITGKPIFSMDHIKRVSSTPNHSEAKKIAHDAIDSSNAHNYNKEKTKLAVNNSKNTQHLAQIMTNHYMAHDAKIRRRLSGKKDHE